MNFLLLCFIFLFYPLGSLCEKSTVENSLSEHLLRATESNNRYDRFENAFIIGRIVGKCVQDNYNTKNYNQCISPEISSILLMKNNENKEILTKPNADDKNFFAMIGLGMQKLIESLQNFERETNETNFKIITKTCYIINPALILKNLLKALKIKYFYIQSAAYNHDVRPFRRLKDAWNSYILQYSVFTGICKTFGTPYQNLPKRIKEFDEVMNEQEQARKERYLHTTVKAMAASLFYNKEIQIEDLKYLRDLLNEMYEDLNLFAVISIPNGNIFIPPTTLSSSYLHHITNLNAHILVYPTLPSNTYKHIRETDPTLLDFNYNTGGPLFGKSPYCLLNPEGTLILSKFYSDIESTCNDRLSCIIFESPMVEAATTNANIFLRNSNIDCGWFSSKDLFLLAKHTPKNDLYYEKEDKHYINIYLDASTRLNNSIFEVANPRGFN